MKTRRNSFSWNRSEDNSGSLAESAEGGGGGGGGSSVVSLGSQRDNSLRENCLKDSKEDNAHRHNPLEFVRTSYSRMLGSVSSVSEWNYSRNILISITHLSSRVKRSNRRNKNKTIIYENWLTVMNLCAQSNTHIR